MEAPLFDIQRFSVHDGPGIRTLVFLKGCALRCPWCSNPESQLSQPQLMLYPEKCIGCHKCLEVCEFGAIFVEGEQLCYNKQLCRACGKCADVCPAEARKLVGKYVDVDYVIKEIEKDILFYRNSGGGVTFGGGEPALFPDFIKAVSIECQKRGINVAVETCGYAPWRNLKIVAEHANLLMFDVKHMDAATHRKLCGHSNKLILDNLKKLCRIGGNEILVRMPIIPGLNDGEENIRNTAEFVSSLGNGISRIELLPYHRFGFGKYERLGMLYQIEEVEVPSDEHMMTIKGVMEEYGLNVNIV
ncbi:MAG: glycyl-radical enzyme activating protein [Desulfobacteraceae bacterium]|nr:glycyl-radical enzyme activating protein [Desulfobacteraceae bacterium]